MIENPFPELDMVIHSPARLQIVSALVLLEEADFVYLLNVTKLTRGNLSTHLSKLEEAGYVAVEKTYKKNRPLTILRLTVQGREAYKLYRKTLLDFLK
ncbi:MAG: transcriptional regulator [Anaerolineaceae bacterium]|jgi:DNA-binding MarR family transcriptional regulator|nr:transcriptional regulator [Anaerolineaceae bacterium]